ncbi:MAG: DUF2007 domain-containing protein [Chloroflexota bacterium]
MTTNDVTPLPADDNQDETAPDREVRWEVVAKTGGITPAEIMVGRLRAEGIPARAWQEGAGEALGLFVGLLGTGHVVVPEEYADRARAILEDVEPIDEEFTDDFEEEG